jgi:hypothetical protein
MQKEAGIVLRQLLEGQRNTDLQNVTFRIKSSNMAIIYCIVMFPETRTRYISFVSAAFNPRCVSLSYWYFVKCSYVQMYVIQSVNWASECVKEAESRPWWQKYQILNSIKICNRTRRIWNLESSNLQNDKKTNKIENRCAHWNLYLS